MLTARELINALSRMDENTPIFIPSVVGYEAAVKVRIEEICFRGSFQEPGEWIEKEHADGAAIARGVLRVAVISELPFGARS